MSRSDKPLTPALKIHRLSLVFLLAAVSSGCGAVKLGSGGGNSQAPNAPILASGSFALNSNSITGSVAIYQLGTNSYEAFLSAFTGPSNSTSLYLAVVDSTGTQDLYTSLTASSGSQGYTFTANLPTGATFSLVSVKQNATTTLAQASL